MRAHSKYRDVLSSQLDMEIEDDGRQARDGAESNVGQVTGLSSQVLHPDEQDMEEPNEKLQEQVEECN